MIHAGLNLTCKLAYNDQFVLYGNCSSNGLDLVFEFNFPVQEGGFSIYDYLQRA